ncbi:MAG: hypothetical protein AB8E15_10555 [Bdellovibrionales bacterium]
MRLIIMLSFFVSTSAFSKVDYIAIGALISNGKKEMETIKTVVSCSVKKLDAGYTCKDLELVNKQFNDIFEVYNTLFFGFCNPANMYNSFYSIKDIYLQPLSDLAGDASANDEIHKLIGKFKNDIDVFENETKEFFNSLKLQDKYTSECLFNQDPPSDSLRSLVCK